MTSSGHAHLDCQRHDLACREVASNVAETFGEGRDFELIPTVKIETRHPVEVIMAALRSRCGHYIFALWFLLSIFLSFPRLISAVADWMSVILAHMVWS